MTLRPEKRGEKLRIVIDLPGPKSDDRYKGFKKELNALVRKYGAKITERRKQGGR